MRTFRSAMRHLLFLPIIFAACRATGEVITSPLVAELRTALDPTRIEAPRLVLDDAPTLRNGAKAICYEHYILVTRDGHLRIDSAMGWTPGGSPEGPPEESWITPLLVQRTLSVWQQRVPVHLNADHARRMLRSVSRVRDLGVAL